MKNLMEAIKWRFIRYKQFLKIRLFTFNKKTLEIEGIKISLGEHISDNIKESFLDGYYEAAELRMVKEKLADNDVVMEIGSGIGFISSYCAKRIGSEKIYTFEANPALESPIRQTYELNKVQPKLEICLLADEEGEIPFYVEKDYWSSSMIRCSEDAKEVMIPMQKLNNKIHDIDPTFLIIDIEGGEHSLFQIIDLYNIKKISIELHNSILGDEKIENIKNKLFDLGYTVDMSVSNVIEGYKEELYFEKAA